MPLSPLATAVVARVGLQRLVELTNENGSSIVIDESVLEASCDDSIGTFERETGIAADTANRTHVQVLVVGVIFHLEMYRARDAGIINTFKRDFFAALSSIREKVYFPATTNSPLIPSKQKQGEKPDMDRSKSIWNYGNRAVRIDYFSGDNP